MSDTIHLQLPYLAAAQAQKHVTHNEALTLLDGLVQPAAKSRALATPPVSPGDGDRYLIAASPTGDWSGQAGKLALRMEGAWRFLTPREGWSLWVDDEDASIFFDGSSWVGAGMPSELQNLALLGVNATADATNKLSVASAATLFNHVGNGHQIKLNKNAAADTASVLYQTGFSGRAEFGTTGDDDFHVKVSSDGTIFYEALVVAAASGLVTAKNMLRLEPQAADPASPTDGQLWYNSTTATFRKRQNGATSDFSGGGSSSWGAITGTLSTQTDLQAALNGKAAASHAHVLADISDVSITAANLNALDDAANTALHFHDSDRARANHTGTQTASTISDFSAATDARIAAASINSLGDVVITTPSTGQVIKFDGTNWTNQADATGGGGVSDGDKGDITVSASGATWTIDPDAVTYAKLQNVSATARVLGRKTAGSGDVEELTGDEVRTLFEGTVLLAGDFTNSTTSFTSVTGMSFTADANATYLVEVMGTFQTAVTTTGIGIGLDIPSGGVSGQALVPSSNTAVLNVLQTADDAIVANHTGVSAANTDFPFQAKYLVKVAGTGGTVQLRWRSEVAASNAVLRAGAATVAGTVMTWRKVG